MLNKRVRLRNDILPQDGPVVYWMSRDQRVEDNWGLVYAQTEARAMSQPLFVIFTLSEQFLGASEAHYAFMAKGLLEVSQKLKSLRIPFHVLSGQPEIAIPEYLNEVEAGTLIADSHVLKECLEWKDQVSRRISISFQEVDAHNIIPVWEASPKAEYGAYTIRPKIKKLLGDYLIEIPSLEPQSSVLWDKRFDFSRKEKHTEQLLKKLAAGCRRKSGSKAAKQHLSEFIESRLEKYHLRNDPTTEATSRLSPYIHFGQISAHRIALEVSNTEKPNKEEFLEELIVRRELADNFCFYNPHYDRFEGFPEWAQKTLLEHEKDRREYLYSEQELRDALTHDLLWNAAQTEMVVGGTMPGYLRMYWAKKILEWTESPKEALRIALDLNNSFQLDGRDANGFVGVAWSIGGVHDRAWAERAIFGKIRFMSYEGAKRKFDVEKYIAQVRRVYGQSIKGHSVDKRSKI